MTTRQPPLALDPDLAPRSLRHFSRLPFLAMNQAPKPSMNNLSHDERVLFPSPSGRGIKGEGQTSSLSSPSPFKCSGQNRTKSGQANPTRVNTTNYAVRTNHIRVRLYPPLSLQAEEL